MEAGGRYVEPDEERMMGRWNHVKNLGRDGSEVGR